ncbi:MAG TPA: relaxase/mobilization nuclease domain-containing protein [Bacillota bacterium]|nr:relaxase/mobilization nuclease domain-containing protein [Bacillota bacterium]HQC48106.1 relaxase/mobilization nuclease domain-containing protein [Bacillota bacterium]
MPLFVCQKGGDFIATTKIRSIRGDVSRTLDYAANEHKITGTHTVPYYQALTDVIDYIEQPEKTHDVQYVTGIYCNERNARDEFVNVKKMFDKEDGIQCFHAIQSFAPGEADADTVHEIGVKLAELMWGDRYQVLVTTHLDKEHLHNHFVINSVSFLDGKKYNLSKGEKRRLRHLSDSLCREHELSVVIPGEQKREAEKLRELGLTPPKRHVKNSSFRAAIRKDINELVKEVSSLEELYRRLESQGYEVKRDREHVAVKAPGMERFARLRSLGDAFIPTALEDRIRRRRKVAVYRPKNTTVQRMKVKHIRYPWVVRRFRFYYRRILATKTWREEMIAKYGRPRIDYESKRIMEDLSAKIRLLYRYGIKDDRQAQAFLDAGLGTQEERKHLKEMIQDAQRRDRPPDKPKRGVREKKGGERT